ncbi:MAG: hypothetical protein D6741_04060 [Planctomycetota bacterium]|nr:MAG: hypothetical protein D6741_04060 [Planctomycetota bacterium]
MVVPPHQLPSGALGPAPPEIPSPDSHESTEGETASESAADEAPAAADDDLPSKADDAPADASNG